MDRPRGSLVGRGSLSLPAAAALLAAPLAFLAVFYAWPVVNIIGEGLRGDGRWDLSGLREVVRDPDLRHVAWFTLWQAALSTALTVALALPTAHVLSRFDFRGRRVLAAVVAVPFVLPTVVVGAAFLGLLGQGGLLGLDLGGTVLAILLAHAFFNHSVVVRTVGGLWEGLDPRTEEAARVLGAGRWATFRAVTWPALRPAVAASAAIVFLFTFCSFGVVRVLGGVGHSTLEVEIYRQTAELLNLPVAAVLALLQLGAVAAMLLVQHRLERRGEAPAALAPRAARVARTRGERAWVRGNVAFLVLWLALPLGALVRQSLRVGDHWSLAGWRGLRVVDGTGMLVPPLEAVGNSLRFAAVATVLAVSLGTLAAMALTRSRHRAVRRIESLLLLPLGTSAVTVGFGFLIALDAPVDLRASPWLVPIAQAIVALPFTVRTISPVIRAIDPRLHDAAAVLGAGPVRTWWWVDLPLLRRALLVAAGFAFAISLGEFGATTVIARADAPTVPVVIGRLLGRAGALNRTEAFALSVVLMVLTAMVALAVDQLRGDERRRGWW